MGCPSIYYLRALQLFARRLTFEDNPTKAEEYLNEERAHILLGVIRDKCMTITLPEVAFYAGSVYQTVLEEAHREGTDQVNACGSGLDAFIKDVGLHIEGFTDD